MAGQPYFKRNTVLKKLLILASSFLLSYNVSAAVISDFHIHPHKHATSFSDYDASSTSEFVTGDIIEDNWHIMVSGDTMNSTYNFNTTAAAGYESATPVNFKALLLDLDGIIGTDSFGNNIYNQIVEISSNLMDIILFSQMMSPDNNYRIAVRGDVTSDFTYNITATNAKVSAVPIPTALWLFAPTLMSILGFRRHAPKNSIA